MRPEAQYALEDATTAWLNTFTPRRFLRNGHIQTLAGNFLPRKLSLPQPEPLVVEVEGPVAGYGPSSVLCHCHWQPQEVRRERLSVVIVHGLEGSSSSRYLLGNTARALAAGFNVVRMNMRTCGGTDEGSPTIYHSGRSEDVAAVVARLIEIEQVGSIALIGYSMGANLVLKYAGEIAGQPPPQLKAVVGISPLMDLTVSSAALHEPQNRIYSGTFCVRCLRASAARPLCFQPSIRPTTSKKIRSMRLFDEHIVARYGGFAGADDYYYSVASSQPAGRFRVPTLILHSLDDPFIRMLPSTRSALIENPSVTYVETERGGHCAFLAPAKNDDGRWAETTLLEYLRVHTNGSRLGR